MSLLVRVNLALVVVFALGATITGLACRSVLQRNAERELHDHAELMMDGALAVRDYTASEVAPLLHAQMQNQFLPQSVPAYAATELFLRLHATRPDYSYQEATLNPTNLRDRATDWQADIIQRFRNDANAHAFSGERDTPMGRALYLAKPIRAGAECLSCHSTAAAAPPTMLARYGSSNGFGWQAGRRRRRRAGCCRAHRERRSARGRRVSRVSGLAGRGICHVAHGRQSRPLSTGGTPGASHGADRRPPQRGRFERAGVPRAGR